jgi:hypothetical protein
MDFGQNHSTTKNAKSAEIRKLGTPDAVVGRLSVRANLRISNWWEPFSFLSSSRRARPFFIGLSKILCGLCVLCGQINSCWTHEQMVTLAQQRPSMIHDPIHALSDPPAGKVKRFKLRIGSRFLYFHQSSFFFPRHPQTQNFPSLM